MSPFSNDPCDFLPVAKINQEELDYCLDTLALNELDANTVAARLIKRMAFILVDNNPTYQAVCRQMESEFAQISAQAKADIQAISKDVLTRYQKNMEVHLAEISSKADEAIASIRINLQATKLK